MSSCKRASCNKISQYTVSQNTRTAQFHRIQLPVKQPRAIQFLSIQSCKKSSYTYKCNTISKYSVSQNTAQFPRIQHPVKEQYNFLVNSFIEYSFLFKIASCNTISQYTVRTVSQNKVFFVKNFIRTYITISQYTVSQNTASFTRASSIKAFWNTASIKKQLPAVQNYPLNNYLEYNHLGKIKQDGGGGKACGTPAWEKPYFPVCFRQQVYTLQDLSNLSMIKPSGLWLFGTFIRCGLIPQGFTVGDPHYFA